MERKKFETENSFKQISFDEVVDYLEANGTIEEKQAFKKACYTNKDGEEVIYTNKDGEEVKKFFWLNGKRWFLENFAPELLPEKKEKPEAKMKRIANW